MFEVLLCPSSGARDYDVVDHIGRFVLVLLYVGGKVQLGWSGVRLQAQAGLSLQPRNNIIKDEKGDLVTDPNNILARWGNEFFQLFNIYVVSDIRQTEIHTTEPLIPELSAVEVDLAIERLKNTNHQVLIKSQKN